MDYLTTENGDRIVTENGDRIVIDNPSPKSKVDVDKTIDRISKVIKTVSRVIEIIEDITNWFLSYLAAPKTDPRSKFNRTR